MLVLGGLLYTVTAAIASGGAITPGTNVAQTTVEAEFKTQELVVDFGTVSSLPVTKNDSRITADHVVLQWELGTITAPKSDIIATTANGSVTVSGVLASSTTLRLFLGRTGATIS